MPRLEQREIETQSQKGQVVKRNAHVRRKGWLPRGVFDDLDALADAHEEAVSDLAEARGEARKIGDKFRSEDESRIKAYETGLDVPQMTDPAERNRLVTEARQRVEGAERGLETVVAECVIAIQRHEDDWQEDLVARRDEALEKREEAERLLAEMNDALGSISRTAQWVRRTAKNRHGQHYAHDELPIEEPYDVGAELEKVLSDGGSIETISAS